ncbi:nitrate- and nitrite sensing domain-containing protein [Actinoplanes oblitus]|uniref:histidine kinase n=1 Tax=Actinoplanes oblitus TaxID=3040509 RepID=A0ABY8WTW0_9ACTN|nr:nitrate- and nitrite sensing domain-containing protein [Actinoplanes oblitus]WIN00356.1 nitrate- and nitrite sensing domain-containing protein [Actinoplanes oblitus]
MSAGSRRSTARRRFIPRLRDVKIRAKLAGLMVIPLAAVLALGTARLIDVRGTASDSDRIAQLTRLGTELAALNRLVHAERMAAVAYLVGDGARRTDYQARVGEVNTQVTAFRNALSRTEDVPSRVRDKLSVIDEQLGKLAGIRQDVTEKADFSVASAVQRYGDVLAGLAGFEESVGQVADPGPVADALRALGAFSRIGTAIAQQEAIAYSVRITGELTAVREQQLIAAQAARDSAFASFRTLAARDQVGVVEAMLADARMGAADGLNTRLTGPGAAPMGELLKAYDGVLTLLYSAEQQLQDRAVSVAEDDSASASWRARVEGVLVLLALAIGVTFAVLLARNLNSAAHRLRDGALTVANRELPDAVHRLKDASDLDNGGVDRIVAETHNPIRLTGEDEFGQVAKAFAVVHREAVRVAAEQAAWRTSVSTMFVSLARRSQRLVDRMIRELDQIEHDEQDPQRLARLFDLDHLATRMRRNDENLLVLAGAEPGAPRREDASLIDVLRAAQSEVEQYNRVDFGVVDQDVGIAAGAIGDVVRLVAELLDNGTRFSPPRTQVIAHGQRVENQVVIQIEDRGLGVSDEQRKLINRRLAEPAEVDVTAFRLMGFAVVARLAARRGIRVRLIPSPLGGTVAEVMLPASILVRLAQPAPPVEPIRRGARTTTPIKMEMRVAWFDTVIAAGQAAPRGLPTAGYAPAPTRAPASAAAAAPASAQPVVATMPRPRAAAEDRWRMRADDGWQRASAAAAPIAAGTTATGLPRRNPQAQLVPGSAPATPAKRVRRDPEAMRSLSTFTNAVQRGRLSTAPGAKENDR